MHIRNAPAEGMKNFGYGKGYLYPHDFPGHYVEQQYLPDKMLGTKYFVNDGQIRPIGDDPFLGESKNRNGD